MEVLSEKEETIYNLDMDMSVEEMSVLREYYKENCPDEEKQSLEVEWAVVNLLKEFVKKETEKK